MYNTYLVNIPRLGSYLPHARQTSAWVASCNPTQPGTANRCGTTNSKPPGPIITMGKSETPSNNSQIIFITLFLAGEQRRLASYQRAKPAGFDIFSSNYTLQDHILSTAGDAVREHLYFTQEPITMINQSITINSFWFIFWNLHSFSTILQKTHFHTHYIVDLIQSLDGGALSLPFKPQKAGV